MHPSASGGHQLPKGESGPASCQVDNVHQDRITGQWGMTLGENKMMDRHFELCCFVIVRLNPFRLIWTIASQGYGMKDREVTLILGGKNGRRPGEPIPFWPGSAPSALGLVPTPPPNGGHPMPGHDSRSASYTVDDVYQDRIT